jgi:hypothetical protein
MAETLRRADMAPQDICDPDNPCSSDVSFQCSALSVFGYADPIAASFCTLESNVKDLLTSKWEIDMDPWISAASMVMVFSTNMDDESWRLALGNSSRELPLPTIKEEWNSYDFGSGSVINATLCFRAWNVLLSNVSMSTDKNLSEPTLGYKSNPSDTLDIRIFYGADLTI